MGPWHYHYAGLRVTSELVVPEWHDFETAKPSDAPDVVIRLDRESPADGLPVLTAQQYHFQVEGVGAYRVDAGREIRIAMLPGAGARETRLFLLGSAWGALCYQRGILVLHSSVAQVRQQAVAFCGASGGGKSSVVAWLAAQGYPLIGDDLCRFELDALAPRVYPAAPRLKLWRDALSILGWRGGNLERDHFRMEKFHMPADVAGSFVAPQASASPLPLRAIYLLAWGEPGITRLTGMTALRQLIESATYRGDLLEPMGLVAAHWQRCATLARRVPIFRFARPRDWSAMDSAMAELTASWTVLDSLHDSE